MKNVIVFFFVIGGLLPVSVHAQKVYQAGSVPVNFSFEVVKAVPGVVPLYNPIDSTNVYYNQWENTVGVVGVWEKLLGIKSEAAAKKVTSKSFVTIPDTMTISGVTGSDLSTNDVPTTLIGSVSFGYSAPVRALY
jgi:hypothetical protein